MAYTINKTDGTPVTTVADGQIDQGTLDITLIGKNYSGFGEFLNENFVKILENFASQSQPNQPLTGQLWYDSNEGRIKVYSGTAWRPVGSALLADARPLTVGTGDFWFNSIDKQLYFFDGSRDYLLGPAYSSSQGTSGFIIETIEDSSRRNRTVVAMYVSGTLIGYLSSEDFVPRSIPQGYERDSIQIGFNPAVPDIFKFRGTSTDAENLGGVEASRYARKDTANTFEDQQTIQSDSGIAFGRGPQGRLTVEGTGDVVIRNIANTRKLFLRVTKNDSSLNSLVITPGDSVTADLLQLYPENLTSVTEVGGNLTVKGNLNVEGSTITVSSQQVQIQDKLIELAVPSGQVDPTDELADGGGIVLKGDTDHSLTWDAATTSWKSTESIDIADGKVLSIDGVPVLEKTNGGVVLTTEVTSAPGLRNFGPQVQITADNITINNNRIFNNGVTGLYADGDTANPTDIVIAPAGNILIEGNSKIRGLSTTNDTLPIQTEESSTELSNEELSEATNKRYVTNLVRTRNLALSLDITGPDPLTDLPLSTNDITSILETILPVAEYDINTLARIATTRYYLSYTLPIQPALTTTTLFDVTGSETSGGTPGEYGVIKEASVDEIPAQLPPKVVVRRGTIVFRLQDVGGGVKGWRVFEDLVEETAPSVSYPSIFPPLV